jgi:hypothetical protein
MEPSFACRPAAASADLVGRGEGAAPVRGAIDAAGTRTQNAARMRRFIAGCVRDRGAWNRVHHAASEAVGRRRHGACADDRALSSNGTTPAQPRISAAVGPLVTFSGHSHPMLDIAQVRDIAEQVVRENLGTRLIEDVKAEPGLDRR